MRYAHDMIPPRRFLPSLSALRALEALDRLGTATAAAEELNQTQSAVSRQLQALEGQLGVTLIERNNKRMHLTDDAQAYVAEIRNALNTIAQASMRLTVKPDGGTLHLAILPTFGMQWLVPRLPDFTRRHPEVAINMSTRLAPFDFATEPFDAALHFGAPDWPGVANLHLRGERMMPVCAPSLLEHYTISKPADLMELPLLHIQTRPEAWRDWFAGFGLRSGRLPGMIHDQFATIVQAAVHGLGVALLPDYLAEPELAQTRLIAAYGQARPMPGAYHLVWPKDRRMSSSLAVFAKWLETQTEDEDALPR